MQSPPVTLVPALSARGTSPGSCPPLSRDQGYVDVAADRLGRFHLIWLDDREETGRHQGLRYARSSDGGQHWTDHQTIDAAACTCCWTTLAAAPSGSVYARYRDVAPHDMTLARFDGARKRWQASGTVGAFGWDFTGCPHAGGGLSVSGESVLDSIVWTGSEPATGLYHLRSADAGRSWRTPRYIGGPHARHGAVAARSRHHIAAAWEAVTDGGPRIYAAQSLDGGHSWSQPQRLSGTNAYATHPQIIAGAFGFWVFWTEHLDGDASQWVTAPLPEAAHRVVSAASIATH